MQKTTLGKSYAWSITVLARISKRTLIVSKNQIFEFTLKFDLPPGETNQGVFIDRLGEEGCEDALVGIGQPGRIALNFCRSASSAFEAISSAIADVRRAIPGTRLIEATPDFVGLTDVAEVLGCSRQYMRKLMISNGTEFPSPVHEGKTVLWRLSEILVWLNDSKNYQIEDSLMEIARITMQVNIAREALGADPDIQKSMRRLIH